MFQTPKYVSEKVYFKLDSINRWVTAFTKFCTIIIEVGGGTISLKASLKRPEEYP
jgi:hypothetical protein